ncbi:hypothetical protein GW17_00010903 [Ensete ventricosum]|nr:hypothetical protein GW17_00010903 [Ensete ventricosum]
MVFPHFGYVFWRRPCAADNPLSWLKPLHRFRPKEGGGAIPPSPISSFALTHNTPCLVQGTAPFLGIFVSRIPEEPICAFRSLFRRIRGAEYRKSSFSMDIVEAYRGGSATGNSSSIWRRGEDAVFSRSFSRDGEDDEEALKWAALEKLPTYDRVRRGFLLMSEGELREIDVNRIGLEDRKSLLERLVRVPEEDNERFLLKLRERIDR